MFDVTSNENIAAKFILENFCSSDLSVPLDKPCYGVDYKRTRDMTYEVKFCV